MGDLITRGALAITALVTCLSLADASIIIDEEVWIGHFMFNYQNHSTCGRHVHGVSSMEPMMPPMNTEGGEDDESRGGDEGDDEAVLEAEFPWQAAILNRDALVCSAVLIHEQYLLTSASCIPSLMDAPVYRVVAGATSLFADNGPVTAQSRIVKEFYVHPRYRARDREFDIALVMVDEPFVIDDQVNVICLPMPSMHRSFTPGMEATITSFGAASMPMEPECPSIPEGILRDCGRTCSDDKDCMENEKCCNNDGCGLQCVPVPGQMDDNEAMPGVLRNYRLHLQDATACQSAFEGDLSDSVICAGGTRQSTNHRMTTEEGGLLGHLARKMRMERMGKVDGNADDEERGRNGEDETMSMTTTDEELEDVDLLQLLAQLLGRVDETEGSLERGRMRERGVWSLGNGDVVPGVVTDDPEEERTREDEERMGGTEGMMESDMMVNPCKGDQGGPLMAQLHGQWYVLGVTTTAPYGCLYDNSPALFTHVFSLKDWIAPIFNGKEPKRKRMFCGMGEFSCGDGWCVPEEYRCDGQADCAMETDEQFCSGALKGYNVYYDQGIGLSTVAHNVTVNSPEECALACFKAPFLCPGFDLYIPPATSPEPTMTGGMEKGVREMDDDGVDQEEDNDEEEEEEQMENDQREGMTMPVSAMVCKLADTMSRVHRINKTADRMMSDMGPGMDGQASTAVKHVHFKLPRNAPLTALLSPQLNLRLPTGVIVSPSYILGNNLSRHIGDHKLKLLFLKKTLKKHLVLLSHESCVMSHDLWNHLEKITGMMTHLKEMAAEMDSEMMDMIGRMNQEEDMVMQMEDYLKNNMSKLLERANQLKVNFTMVKKELLAGCNFTNITNNVEHMLTKLLVNYTCMIDDDRMNPMYLKDDPTSAFEELMNKIGLKNMYMIDDETKMMMKMGMEDRSDSPMGRGMDGGMDNEMDNISGLESLLGDGGSMVGDFWVVLGNNDFMSKTIMDLMTMTMEGEDRLPNITAVKNKLVMKIKRIAAMMMMSRCNKTATLREMGLGDITGMIDRPMAGSDAMMGGVSASGDMMGGVSASGDMMGGDTAIDGDETMMEWDLMDGERLNKRNLTEKQNMVLTAIDLLNKVPTGHHRWTIVPSPHETNKIHFRVLESRGPPHCDNVPRDFGMMVARGGTLPPPMELLRSELLRKKMMLMNEEGGEMADMDRQILEMRLRDVAMGMFHPVMTSMMDDDADMGNAEDVLARMVEKMNNMMGEDGGGMMGGDMMGDVTMRDGDAQTSGQGSGAERQSPEEMNAYQSAEKEKLLMKLKKKDGKGVANCLNELPTGKVFAVNGLYALIDQYSNHQESHGIIMEYGSGYSCDQTITDGPGTLTSPMFPMRYPSNAACNDMIVAPPGHVVVLFMLRFRTQWHPDCMQDKLTVYDEGLDGWSKVGGRSYCGNTVPHVFRSRGQRMRVKFETAKTAGDTGFQASYMFVPAFASAQSILPGMQDGMPPGDGGGERNQALVNSEMLERLFDAQDEADTYKIALIAVACVLGAVIVVGMVAVHFHYQNKIRKLTDHGHKNGVSTKL